MSFKVFVVIEAPLLDERFELLVPIDRRINDLVEVLRNNVNGLNENYYSQNNPNLYNKYTGALYDLNEIIKDSDIKTGTRLLLL